MKFSTVLLTLFFSACVLSGIVWLGQDSDSDKKNELIEPQSPEPKIAGDGPHPKVVVDEMVHDFVQGFVGQEYSHVFTLRNEGNAPLVLTIKGSTCQCTISSLGKNEVLPGESGEITLTWKPTKPDEFFSHSAHIGTNDPKSQIIKLQIEGEVALNVMVMPEEIWSMPDILEGAPTTYSGHIYSKILEEFVIKELKTTNPLLSAKHFKLSKAELANSRMASGFRIELELKQGVPVGSFNESLTITTNVEFTPTHTVNILGHRYGPITIIPIKTNGWSSKKMGLDMGDFAASEGRTSILHLYVRNLDHKDLEFRDIEVDPEYLKFSFAPDALSSGDGPKRYVLTFKILPGTPRTSRGKQNPARIRLKTNHPGIPEMNFIVHFISR